MSSSQKKPTKSTKTTKANKKKSTPPSISTPMPGCYVPQPIDPMAYAQIPQNWGMNQHMVNNWLFQAGSPTLPSPPQSYSPQMSPPLETLSQFVPESQFLRNTPRRLEDEVSDDDDQETEEAEQEEEEDEDMEEAPLPNDKGKTPRLSWHDDEIRCLGEAWVDCSQQAETGTNQTTQAFKVKVWKSWCRRMGSTYRNPSSLYSKWRTCNKSAMEFQGCHAEVERQRQSGANGDDVMAKARLLYQAQYGSQFTQEVFWRAVKDYEKWKQLESFDQFVVHISKKHKPSETPTSPSSEPSVGFNLNNDPPNPPGRDDTKRKNRGKAQATTSNSTNSSVHEDLLALSGNVESYKEALKIKENAERMKESNLKIKEKMQLRKIIQQDTSGKSGFELELLMEMKRDAARQLGLNINF